MIDEIIKLKQWRVITETACGRIHQNKKLPNQDAMEIWQPVPTKLPLIVALSDGNGGPKSFRSHLGSLFAVKSALKILQRLIEQNINTKNLRSFSSFLEDKLPQQIVNEWKKKVEIHFKQNALTQQELNHLAQQR